LEKQIDEMRLYENYVPLAKRIPTPNEILIKTVQEFYQNRKAGTFQNND
jgi:hypothetical protein